MADGFGNVTFNGRPDFFVQPAGFFMSDTHTHTHHNETSQWKVGNRMKRKALKKGAEQRHNGTSWCLV